jgi:hypothetical protein
VLIVGPVGVGKTSLANALRAHRRSASPQRAYRSRRQTLFKHLRVLRLDGSYEDEMRKLHRVELLIINLSHPAIIPTVARVDTGIVGTLHVWSETGFGLGVVAALVATFCCGSRALRERRNDVNDRLDVRRRTAGGVHCRL